MEQPQNVVILISGGGLNMVRLVESMTRPGHPGHTALVFSNDPGATGLALAHEMRVATASLDHRAYGSREDFETAMAEYLDAAEPDVICLAGFMRILTPDFVRRYAGKMLNIHPSLLPRYPGLHTHQRAIEAGDAWAGCTVHEVTAELDAGPILGQARVAIEPGDTADTLAARVLKMEHQLYPLVLRRFLEGHRDRIDIE